VILGPTDAVILAGGESRRLAGIVPPHHKPFLVVEGESLLVRAVQQAHKVGVRRIVIVTCPEIALPVYQLLAATDLDLQSDYIHFILRTGGPGFALRAGLELCRADRVLVLMADNVNRTTDISDMVSTCRYAVGVQKLRAVEALRYTRWIGNRWIEDKSVEVFTKDTIVWCGPLIIDRIMGLQHLGMTDGAIGPHLDYLAPDGELQHFEVKSYDIGTPEAIAQFTGGKR
jgi:molybdopterin-guanine dinucleotide biosynthesis protein A